MNLAAKVRELAASAWTSGSNFATDDDTRDIEPYYRGLQIGRDADAVYVSVDGTWRANMRDGRAQTDGKIIGVTPNTRWLYQGLLDSRVAIFVQRFVEGRIRRYELLVSPDGMRTPKEIEDSGRVR